MSYENGTTHYNLPQTVGSDKRDWFDTNQAFANIDADLYSAKETADSTALNVANIQEQIVTIQSDVLTAEGNISALQGGLATANENIGLNNTKIAEVKADALDMICAVDEGTAQVATVAVDKGKYFRYNDVLYMATANIRIGDTIVPNTNCRATNVSTELAELTDLSGYTQIGTTGVYYRKYLKFVEVMLEVQMVSIGPASHIIATLPIGCRPLRTVNFLSATTIEPDLPQPIIGILPNGGIDIRAWASIDEPKNIYGHHIFLVE